MPHLARFVAPAVANCWLLSFGLAQCDLEWQSGLPLNGTDGRVHASTMWDPDGAGPAPPLLVLAGSFTVAGNVAANRIATFEPTTETWGTLGSGANGDVRALTVLDTGELVAGGEFTAIDGVVVNYVARWNGTSWSGFAAPPGFGVGIGTNAPVMALTSRAGGQLIAGGFFTQATGVNAAYLAWWNGTNWLSMDSSGMNDAVWALATLPNGDVIAGGNFTGVGGLALQHIGRWDGLQWHTLGNGTDARVNCLQVMPNGDVVAGGRFLDAGGQFAQRIARWDGFAWSPLGNGLLGGALGECNDLALAANGDLLAAGFFTGAGMGTAVNVARWNGSLWFPVGSGIGGFFYSLPLSTVTVLPSGRLIAGGLFSEDESNGGKNVALYDGTDWGPVTGGFVGTPGRVLELANGDLVAAGGFTAIGSLPALRIAIRSNGVWSAMGSGFDNSVQALVRLPTGDLIAAGRFVFSGSTQVNRVARWNGSSWQPLGSGINGDVDAAAVMPNGDLVVGGTFSSAGGVPVVNVARWNGSSWSAIGNGVPGIGGTPALAVDSTGNLWASRVFTNPFNQVFTELWQWNGASWSAISPPANGAMLALAALRNGDIAVGGTYSIPTATGIARQIARWDGSAWQRLAEGLQVTTFAQQRVLAIAELPNGDLVAGGEFDVSGATPVQNIARWNGTAWSQLEGGVDGVVGELELTSNGRLLVAGSFLQAGGQVIASLAELQTSCPPNAASSGTGCSGSAGPNVLAAATQPWVGSNYQAIATGLPGNAIAIELRGLLPTSVPLATIVPQASIGCGVFVLPTLFAAYAPTAGSITTQFPLPNSPALAGQTFHQQIVTIELDALGNTIDATSTNALALTIGLL